MLKFTSAGGQELTVLASRDHMQNSTSSKGNVQIGLVRNECTSKGIYSIKDIAKAYDLVKTEQSKNNVWCYDNYTESGSNTFGLVKSREHDVAKDCIIWPINHYLGLNRNKHVKNSAIAALEQFGTGCGTSAMSGGHSSIHKKLEERLRIWLGKEDVLLFPTGYSANVGAISGLAKCPSTFILFDRECHASIVDGIKLSGAKFLPFRHNDVEDLERKLNIYGQKYVNIIVIAESIYSMTGEESPIVDICNLKKYHDFLLFIDEAHSFGLFKERTLCKKYDVIERVDFIMTTLSKATASIGGVVAMSKEFRTLLQVEANSYLFQAAISPADAGAIIGATDVIEKYPEIIDALWEKVSYMKGRMTEIGADIGHSASPIIPVYVRDSDILMKMGLEMYEQGVFTTSVAYPVVKHSEVRFRFILNNSHTYDQIDRTVETVQRIGRKYGILKSNFGPKTAEAHI